MINHSATFDNVKNSEREPLWYVSTADLPAERHDFGGEDVIHLGQRCGQLTMHPRLLAADVRGPWDIRTLTSQFNIQAYINGTTIEERRDAAIFGALGRFYGGMASRKSYQSDEAGRFDWKAAR